MSKKMVVFRQNVITGEIFVDGTLFVDSTPQPGSKISLGKTTFEVGDSIPTELGEALVDLEETNVDCET